MKKIFAASAMILAMSAATVLSPLTAFAETEEQELNIAIFQGGYGDAYWNQMVELFEQSHERGKSKYDDQSYHRRYYPSTDRCRKCT